MNQPLELAVVIPTYNELRNVPVLVAKLDAALKGRNWEAIFVDDDSPDGTADAARDIAPMIPAGDAILFDSTPFTLEQVVERVITALGRLGGDSFDDPPPQEEAVSSSQTRTCADRSRYVSLRTVTC